MMRYSEMWPKYARWWDAMRANAGREREFSSFADRAFASKEVYKEIEARSGVPWTFIALSHKRENGPDFDHARFACYLGNGQSLSRRTTIVPEGRGPFLGSTAFLRGALDALAVEGMSAIRDWRLEKVLYWLEIFNGTGYALRGLPSPYVWGGTNVQRPGKFIADHKFRSRVVDPQPGCAPMLAALMALDKSVVLSRES